MSRKETTGKDLLIVFMVSMVGAFFVQLLVYYELSDSRMAWPGIGLIIANAFAGAFILIIVYQVIKMLEKHITGE